MLLTTGKRWLVCAAVLLRRDDHGTKRGKRAVDAQEPKATVPSLGVENPIERITVLVTQLARYEQRFHLDRQGTQTVGECLISEAPRLEGDFTLAPFEAQFPN